MGGRDGGDGDGWGKDLVGGVLWEVRAVGGYLYVRRDGVMLLWCGKEGGGDGVLSAVREGGEGDERVCERGVSERVYTAKHQK